MAGNEDNLKKIIQWFNGWSAGDDPLLLYGPPGLGKTTAAHALAEDFGYETFEVNASDHRKKEDLEEKLIPNAQAKSHYANGRLVIVDEADNLHSGGNSAVKTAINEATNPMVLIANDYWDGISGSLRDRCLDIEFTPPDPDEIVPFLMRTLNKEGIEFGEKAVRRIADRSMGDVRAALNDLQSMAVGVDKVDTQLVTQFYQTQGGGRKDRSHDDWGDEWKREHEPPWNSSVAIVGDVDATENEIHNYLDIVKDDGFDMWFVGGRTDFDMTVAEYAIEHDIDFKVVLPQEFKRHTENWRWQDRERLENILKELDGLPGVAFQPEQAYMPEIHLGEYHEIWTRSVDAIYYWVDDHQAPEMSVVTGKREGVEAIDLGMVGSIA